MDDGYLYRLVNDKGHVVSGYNKGGTIYESLRSAKSARAQLRRYSWSKTLIIQRMPKTSWESVE